jgi:hypothetical protein
MIVLKFLRDQSETLPKTILFTSCQQLKKRKGKRDCAAGQGKKNEKKRVCVIFHGNYLKNQKQSVR